MSMLDGTHCIEWWDTYNTIVNHASSFYNFNFISSSFIVIFSKDKHYILKDYIAKTVLLHMHKYFVFLPKQHEM